MPSKNEALRKRIPKKLDRRRKLSGQDKEDIVAAHREGNSILGLARVYNVSRRTIQFTVYPERATVVKRYRQMRGNNNISKEAHRRYIQRWRKWRRTLDERGLLLDAEVTDNSDIDPIRRKGGFYG